MVVSVLLINQTIPTGSYSRLVRPSNSLPKITVFILWPVPFMKVKGITISYEPQTMRVFQMSR
jgi:hypothetical protein